MQLGLPNITLLEWDFALLWVLDSSSYYTCRCCCCN